MLPKDTRSASHPRAASPHTTAAREAIRSPDLGPAPVLPDGTTFAAGDIAAGRFRIVHLIARGGMGEVYEALDLELRAPVALKTVRPEIAADPAAVERLKRELQLARQVTHPNVCRVFDFWQDPDAGAFVTMELVGGETLAARIKRAGRVTPAIALPIVEQMAAGLAAAHRAGVVHRDLKSGNVLLEPTRPGEPPRAVITDFGIAVAEVSAGTPAEPERWIGTPDYMAPEQVAGEAITPAADLYALGMVMYEMVAGVTAFEGPTAHNVALKRLSHSPPSPRNHVPDLDPRWEAAILRCLARNPGDRFPSAPAVIEALVGREGRRRRRTAAVLGFRNRSGDPQLAWMSTALAELIAADLAAGEGLEVLPGDDVARAVASPAGDHGRAETLGVELLVEGGYEALPRAAEAAGQCRFEVRLIDARTGAVRCEIAESARVDDLLELAERVSAELRGAIGLDPLTPAEYRRARAAFPANAQALQRYAEGLDRLRVFDDQGAIAFFEAAIAADPGFPLAYGALAEGWSRLGHDAKAAEAARRAFELSGALAREERLLTEVHYRELSGDKRRALDIMKSLFVFYPDRLEYGLRLVAAEVELRSGREALATVDVLRALPPPAGDDPRLDLAEAQAAHADSDLPRARAAAERAALEGEARGARWITARARSFESRVLRAMGELSAAAQASEAARRIHLETGNRSGAAHELMNLGAILRDQGELVRACELFEKALPMTREIGNRKGTATALTTLGALSHELGDPQRAMSLHEEALGIWREIENSRGIQISLNNVGSILWQSGDIGAAQEKFEEAMALARAQGNRKDEAFFLNNLASMLADQGCLQEARRSYETALEMWREVGDRLGIAWGLKTLGVVVAVQDELGLGARLLEEGIEILRSAGEARTLPDMMASLAQVRLWQGDVAGARTLADDALAEARVTGYQGNTADSLHRLGTVYLAAGELEAARAALEEAIQVRQRIGETVTIATAEMTLAEVALAAGNPTEGAERAARAARDFKQRRQDAEMAHALAVMALARLALEDPAGAEGAMLEAQALATTSENRHIRRTVAIAAGIVQGNLGHEADAVRLLETALAGAEAAGHVEHAAAARLALGRLDLLRGRREAGLARLAALEREARARGLALIARQAQRASAS
jgi:tetratricopeptide (TPR) repeat protein/TolB-like protein